MLSKLRNKKTAKKIWIFLAILILPAFILWGAGSITGEKGTSGYVGKVAGRKITWLEYKDSLDAARNEAIIQFQDRLPEAEKYLDLESQAWMRIILLAEAKKRKIKATNQEVITLIQAYPFFKGKNGQFDQNMYSQTLQYVFHTQARIFEEQLRQGLMLAKLYQAVTDEVKLTDEEIKTEYRKANEQISIEYIAGLYSEFAKGIDPSGDEIKDYFASNSFRFKQPLSFNLEYIAIIQEAKNNQEENQQAKIKGIFLRLKKEKDLQKIAKELNLEVKETGLFAQNDAIPQLGWSPQIISLLSRMEPGRFLPPVSVDKGYYIMRLKEKREPYIPPLETIKEKVKSALIQDKAKGMAKEKIEACLKDLKNKYLAKNRPVDFTSSARALGLKVDYTDLFGCGTYIEGIGASDSFWTATEGLKEGGVSGIIEMPSGFYIIKLKNRVSVDENKFAKEKEAFSHKLLLQKKERYFAEFVSDLKQKTQQNL
ncbi:MAG: peptidylprolyl isomerase [Candidatus Omnitrophota bacterium]